MPTPYLEKVAKELNMSLKDVEDKWEAAKEATDKEKYNGDVYWAVVTSIFKKMVGLKEEDSLPVMNFRDYMEKE